MPEEPVKTDKDATPVPAKTDTGREKADKTKPVEPGKRIERFPER